MTTHPMLNAETRRAAAAIVALMNSRKPGAVIRLDDPLALEAAIRWCWRTSRPFASCSKASRTITQEEKQHEH